MIILLGLAGRASTLRFFTHVDARGSPRAIQPYIPSDYYSTVERMLLLRFVGQFTVYVHVPVGSRTVEREQPQQYSWPNRTQSRLDYLLTEEFPTPCVRQRPPSPNDLRLLSVLVLRTCLSTVHG